MEKEIKITKEEFIKAAKEAQDQDTKYLSGSRPFFRNDDIFWKIIKALNKKDEKIRVTNGGYYADELKREIERVLRELISEKLIKINKADEQIENIYHAKFFLTQKGYAVSKGTFFRLKYWFLDEENLWKIISPAIAVASLIVSIIALTIRYRSP